MPDTEWYDDQRFAFQLPRPFAIYGNLSSFVFGGSIILLIFSCFPDTSDDICGGNYDEKVIMGFLDDSKGNLAINCSLIFLLILQKRRQKSLGFCPNFKFWCLLVFRLFNCTTVAIPFLFFFLFLRVFSVTFFYPLAYLFELFIDVLVDYYLICFFDFEILQIKSYLRTVYHFPLNGCILNTLKVRPI